MSLAPGKSALIGGTFNCYGYCSSGRRVEGRIFPLTVTGDRGYRFQASRNNEPPACSASSRRLALGVYRCGCLIFSLVGQSAPQDIAAPNERLINQPNVSRKLVWEPSVSGACCGSFYRIGTSYHDQG